MKNAPGHKAPRLKDVAEAAGVHPATASRALNFEQADKVRPETAERVRRAAEDLGYRLNGMARGLRTKRSLVIGMLVPDISNPFFPSVVRGAESVLEGRGYSLMLSNTDDDQERERLLLARMLEFQVEGLLTATARRQDPLIEALQRGLTPVVLVNRTVDRGGIPAVIPDDYVGMTLAVEHLRDVGHQLIAHVAGPRSTSTGARRARGFADAMSQLEGGQGCVVEAGGFNVSDGYHAGCELFGRRPRPTAIVAASDRLAIGVMHAARELGIRCPRDFSLVGFNDMPFVDQFCPPLTSVRIPEFDMGRRSADLLLNILDGSAGKPTTVMVSPELIVRESTAAP